MFRKIFIKYFPKEEKDSISPVNFHLKLLSPKLLYAISSKYSLNNRRAIQIDSKLHYFTPHNLTISNDIKEENFFYSYKIFSSLNGYKNYSIHTIASTLSIITFYLYYDHIEEEKTLEYLNPLLYGINYLIFMFFSHFKKYPFDNKKENLQFMILLLEKIILHIEYAKDPKNNYKRIEKFTKELIQLIKIYPEYLMFLYELTSKVYKYFEYKPYTDIQLYEYLTSGNLLDFPSEGELRGILKESSKKIFLKRESLYIDQDIITLLNVISGDNIHLNYLLNKKSLDFLPYFIESLEHLENVSLQDEIEIIIDKTLDFNIWGENYIKALKEYNSDNIDINIELGKNIEQVKDMMSKEVMDKVKKVSIINEWFLDYFIFLIGETLNNNADNCQFEFLYDIYLDFVNGDKNNDLNITYTLTDKLYFKESYFYKNKKEIKPLYYHNFPNKIIGFNIYKQAYKIILSDFNKKEHIEEINSKIYFEIIKRNFSNDIKKLIKDVEKNYIKLFPLNIRKIKFSQEQFNNFKKNIYYPDFIVWYNFLKFLNKKITKDEILSLSLLKESLFGYLITRHYKGYNENIENTYKLAINSSYIKIKYDYKLELFYEEFLKENKEFLDFFINVKQNKEFIDLIIKKISDKNSYIELEVNYLWDNFRDISYYNKRLFKI